MVLQGDDAVLALFTGISQPVSLRIELQLLNNYWLNMGWSFTVPVQEKRWRIQQGATRTFLISSIIMVICCWCSSASLRSKCSKCTGTLTSSCPVLLFSSSIFCLRAAHIFDLSYSTNMQSIIITDIQNIKEWRDLRTSSSTVKFTNCFFNSSILYCNLRILEGTVKYSVQRGKMELNGVY